MYELSRNRFKELKHFCLQYSEMKERIKMLENSEYSKAHDDKPGQIAPELVNLQHAVKLIETTATNIGKFPREKILKIVTEDKTIGEVCPDICDRVECEWYVRKFYWMLSLAKGV